ncbi:Protein slit [Chionoecetes opilio]|uniref:Protein slit n=1 Tax=Chionoecetes opilio TaxID=41210 RepID=A0A8J4YPH1_CHIOP|nr:Protein slit [Chionoecetes opilio]
MGPPLPWRTTPPASLQVPGSSSCSGRGCTTCCTSPRRVSHAWAGCPMAVQWLKNCPASTPSGGRSESFIRGRPSLTMSGQQRGLRVCRRSGSGSVTQHQGGSSSRADQRGTIYDAILQVLAKCDHCYTLPCQNGATCHSLANRSYECERLPAYYGPNCQDKIAACYANPWHNFGTLARSWSRAASVRPSSYLYLAFAWSHWSSQVGRYGVIWCAAQCNFCGKVLHFVNVLQMSSTCHSPDLHSAHPLL